MHDALGRGGRAGRKTDGEPGYVGIDYLTGAQVTKVETSTGLGRSNSSTKG